MATTGPQAHVGYIFLTRILQDPLVEGRAI